MRPRDHAGRGTGTAGIQAISGPNAGRRDPSRLPPGFPQFQGRPFVARPHDRRSSRWMTRRAGRGMVRPRGDAVVAPMNDRRKRECGLFHRRSAPWRRSGAAGAWRRRSFWPWPSPPRPRRRSTGESCGSRTATAPPACRSTRKARSPSWLPMMGVFNNLVTVRPAQEAEQPRRHRAGSRREAGRGARTARRLTFTLREGCEVARWPAVRRGRREMHVGSTGRQRTKENFKVNFRKGWYANVESVTANAPTARRCFVLKNPQPALAGAARVRLHAGLSRAMCPPRDHAPGTDRDRAPSSLPSTRPTSRIKVVPQSETTGSRACRTSTASNTQSSPTDRRRCCPSSRASST